jgi:hypothetical protein
MTESNESRAWPPAHCRARRATKRLAAATTDAQRELVEQEIDANANAWAELIRSGDQPGYRATRDAFCRAHR